MIGKVNILCIVYNIFMCLDVITYGGADTDKHIRENQFERMWYLNIYFCQLSFYRNSRESFQKITWYPCCR